MAEQLVALPLAGLKVVELGSSVAAPYAGLVLAELGANVIKIEKPGKGDDARGWGPPFYEGVGTIFHSLNRNKQSVVVDLGDNAARAQLRQLLVGETDVLIQNMRPGQAEKLGFGAEALLAENPRLVHATIAAFGQAGPLSDRPGYDPLMQAFGGLMSVTGEEGRPPIRVGTSLIDMGSGMWIVIGVLAALLRRTETGKGGIVGTSLFETALGWMLYHVTAHAATGEEPKLQGSGSPFIAPYGGYRTKDSMLIITAGNNSLFQKLAMAVGHPEWIDDPRFHTNGDRVGNRAVLEDLLNAALSERTTSEWVSVIEAAGVPCAPIQTVGQVVAHPQTHALDILRRSADGKLGFIGLPLSFEGMRPARNEPVPDLGAHTDDVFAKALL
ncbi:MAG: CoA transferase [Rhodospirillales bacterium]|nr:CoA transferase [Rhodospirillales bacterium]